MSGRHDGSDGLAKGGARRGPRPGLRPVAVLALFAASALGAACGDRQRCDEASAKTCPAGQERRDPLNIDLWRCEWRYDDPCAAEWADYVDCVADNAPTCYDPATKTYTSESPCYPTAFKLFAKCQCARFDKPNDAIPKIGPKSSWCWWARP